MILTIESSHIPPSTNSLFVNVRGRGRVRSKAYRDWASIAQLDYRASRTISGDFSVVITLDRGRTRKGSDIDNRIKAILDMLVTNRVVKDDSRCVSVTIRYGEATKGVRVEVASA